MQPVLDTAHQKIERGFVVNFETREVEGLNDIVPVEVGIALVDGLRENFGIPALDLRN